MLWLNLSILYMASIWFFRHDTKKYRIKNVQSGGDRIIVLLMHLVAPLFIPYLTGLRILRRFDKPFTEDAKLGIEDYVEKKYQKCDSDEGVNMMRGSYALGLLPYAAIVVGTILGTPYLEAHMPAFMKWVGEVMMSAGR